MGDIVNAANTKLIAKWMGHFVNPVTVDGFITVDCQGHWIDYNPITNADQRFELLEKLLGLGAVIDKGNDTYWVRIKDKGIHATGTLPLAIYKTALWEAKK